MTGSDEWRRLHPLTPIVRGGRATIGLAVILLPSALAGRHGRGSLIEIGVVAVLLVLGFVRWLVTRWKVDGDDLRIESGLIRRRSVRFPLSQVQAVDVVRPGLARLFRVAELRLRLGGSTGGSARLAYLAEREVEPLRARFLELAAGTGPAPAAVGEERVLSVVPTGRLIGSILISDVGVAAETVVLALVVVAVVSPAAAVGAISGGAFAIVSALTLVWRRFNQEYRLTVVDHSDGLILRGGLIALTSETIRPGRVQAVRMVEPVLWRRLGWCRLEVDVAGRQRSEGEGSAQRKPLRAVLPVGSHAVAEELLDHLVPDRPRQQSKPPGRARWKSPLRYRMLAWGRTDTCVGTTSGRLRRVTSFVPLEKAQSVRRVQGPVQRRLGLASVYVDTVGRRVHAAIRDREADEAEGALEDLAVLARAARRAA
ncbi:MAG TPA: PH domain-containing protein [Gaiellaceae bacterium]|jgi:putative membrane protein